MHIGQEDFKKTRRGTYYSYLFKWKNAPTKDATWMSQANIERVV